jgi:hypothetical protein
VARADCRGLLAACALLGVVLTTRETRAFCRTMTCDPNDPNATDACQYTDVGCALNGFPLQWKPACLGFSAQQDGSERLGIGWNALNGLMGTAYFNWTHADCGSGQKPSLEVFLRSPVYCDQVQYNAGAKEPNANIWMFREQDWEHEPNALALTTVTFNPKTGEIYDADVELNSAQQDFSLGDQYVVYDLASVVQHESGHTLGLAHSFDTQSTMFAVYSTGETLKRDLSADDAQGICFVYPPQQNRGLCDPSPRHGFSGECTVPASKASGCAFVRPEPICPFGAGSLGLALLGAWGLGRRRSTGRSRDCAALLTRSSRPKA